MSSNRQSEDVLRKSVRLANAGYYDHRGKPVISYKETATYRKRRFSTKGLKETILKKISGANEANGASGAHENSRAYWANRASGANEASWNCIISWLCMLVVYLGILSCTLALFLNINSLDSGPSASPSTKLDTALSRAEGLGRQQMRSQRIKEPPGDVMPNFALESQGAHVLTELSSKSYQCPGPICFLLSLTPLWLKPVDPSIVTQGEHIVGGRCWPFHGQRGHLVIALSHPVTISHVTLGHISKTVWPHNNISSSPKVFAVYGMKTKEDEGTLLGTFHYEQDGDSVQTFKLSEEGVFSHVKLQVQSNWGDPDYTCLYNFRVHGTI